MNPALFSSATDKWATPRDLYAALHEEFAFDLDPCPIDYDPATSDDGLVLSWRGRRVFCNPPYGPGIADWLRQGLEADVAVYLLPARTDTHWFHKIVLPRAQQIRFLRGRLKFGGSVTGAPFPSIVVVFRKGAP